MSLKPTATIRDPPTLTPHTMLVCKELRKQNDAQQDAAADLDLDPSTMRPMFFHNFSLSNLFVIDQFDY